MIDAGIDRGRSDAPSLGAGEDASERTSTRVSRRPVPAMPQSGQSGRSPR
jgi:hypothetical protein